MDLHGFLVLMAKTFGLLWMMAIFLGAAWYAYRPKNRARHEAAGRSVLDAQLEARGRE
ncbi:MAG: cbb3-type cytochrome c oxidase subunit 3 [Rubellimicrobium sp.]|nr:cbb3-type cytochrome c oxidase subunit 3 [Rubellimicrobium sp.]